MPSVKQQKTQGQYYLTECHGQLVFTLNIEIIIPKNDPVRLQSAQLKELEYGKLYEAYSSMIFNVKKYWMKRENGRLKTQLSELHIS